MTDTRAFLVLVCVSLGSIGCAALIKKPVNEKCEGFGLKGCGELAEGVLLYAKGDSEAGRGKIEVAASLNSPEQLRGLASSLQSLEKIKGIGDVVRILNASSADRESGTSPGGGADGDAGSKQAVAAAGAGPSGVADPDFLDSHTVVLADNWTREKCFPGLAGGAETRCFKVTEGPLVLTDIVASPSCPGEVMVAAGSGDRPAWWLSAPKGDRFLLQSGGFVVGAGERLVVGVREESDSEALELSRDSCYVAWSGARTERVERRPVQLTSKQIRQVVDSLATPLADCRRAYADDKTVTVRVKLEISGASGRVGSAEPQDAHAKSTLGTCVRGVFEAATFPQFERETMKAVVPANL